MDTKVSTGKTIFKIACATGGAVLASGVGLPWLGAMAGSCLPKVLEGTLGFLVASVDDDKKKEVLASLLQKPIEQLGSLGVEFAGSRIDDFFKSHFEAKDAELNFDLPRVVVKIWEDGLSRMLNAQQDISILGLERNLDMENRRRELLRLWRQKLHNARFDNNLLREFFGEKPDYFLEAEAGRVSFIDVLPNQEEVEHFFWTRIGGSFRNWANHDAKLGGAWEGVIDLGLQDELKKNLFHGFSAALKQELKQNERAWKSFEFASSLQTVSMLKSVSSAINELKDSAGIKRGFAELDNETLDLLMRETMTRFDELDHTLKDFFESNQSVNELLIDFRRDVTNRLFDIHKDVNEIKGDVKELRKAAQNSSKANADAGKVLPKTIYFPETPIGRTDNLEVLQKAYDSGKRKFLLHGLGGVGKTRIGLEFAKQYGEIYEGQCFVDMQGLSEVSVSAESAMLQIIRQFEPTTQIDAGDPVQIVNAYRDLFRRGPAMIVLDNAENLESVELLCQAHGVFVVITSRDAFEYSWERDTGELFGLEVNQMFEQDAEALLFSIAGEERFEGRAKELAKLVGYLPMGLKVLAGILYADVAKVETAASLIAKYQDTQQLLLSRVPGYKHLPFRDKENLRIVASFELSYKKLTDEQRLYWRWLSIAPSDFGADFDLETLRHILGISMGEANQVQTALRNHSLLEFNTVTERFKFHDLARAFANSRLDEDSLEDLNKEFFLKRWAIKFQLWLFPEFLPQERLEASYRHADHYVDVFAEAYELKHGDSENGFTSALNLLDKEWPNIVAGQKWAAAHFEMDPRYAETCCRYSSFSEFLDLRMTLQESIAWQEASIRAAKRLKNKKRVGMYSGNLGVAYRQLGNFDKAIECHALSLAIAQEFNNEDGIASAMGNLATVYTMSGRDNTKALDLLETVLRMARATNNKGRESLALGTLGNIYYSTGDVSKAIHLFNESLAIARDIGDLHGQSIALGNLANAYHRSGEGSKAREFDEQALQIAQRIGDKFGENLVRQNLNAPQSISTYEEFEDAVKNSEELLKGSRENGNHLEEFRYLFQLGQIYFEAGIPPEAIEYLNLALDKARQIGDKEKELRCLNNLGTVFGMLGDGPTAIEICEEALRIARETGDRLHEGMQLQMLGQGYAGLGEMKKACTHWKQALEVFVAIKSPKVKDVTRMLMEARCS